jgi:hypothetical protein
VFDVIGKTDEFLKYSEVGVDAGFPIIKCSIIAYCGKGGF